MGMICEHCEEPIQPGEPLFHQCCIGSMEPLHHECGFRLFCGSFAHHARTCSCYVTGSLESDPPGMTKREAAKAALSEFLRHNEP